MDQCLVYDVDRDMEWLVRVYVPWGLCVDMMSLGGSSCVRVIA